MMNRIQNKDIVYSGLGKNAKNCFCIGPEKCNDSSCRLVKEYREQQKQRGHIR